MKINLTILGICEVHGDRIKDGYERRTEYWEYGHNRTAWNVGRYLSPAWYYISLAAATFGLTISALKLLFPPMSAKSKVFVDIILLGTSVLGFVSWLRIMKEPGQIWRKFIAEITTTIEFFLALGGLISLGINMFNDWQTWNTQQQHGGS